MMARDTFECLIWVMCYTGLRSLAMHPGNLDNTWMTLDWCAEEADNMMHIVKKRFPVLSFPVLSE